MNYLPDILLHRDPERSRRYRADAIRWSKDLQRWMVFDSGLIAEVLQSPDFVVHDYRFDRILNKHGLHFPHFSRVRDFLPLATEGDEHAALRNRMIHEISSNTAAAVRDYEQNIARSIEEKIVRNANGSACMVQDIFLPSLRDANIAIAGLAPVAKAISSIANLEDLPLFFDDTISVKQRAELDATAGEVLRVLPSRMDDDEKAFRLAMLVLGLDTLSSTVMLSLKTILKRQPGVTLSRIAWDAELPATGLPIVERKARQSVKIAETSISADDRVRLFVDSAGFQAGRCPHFSELYFAAGAHQCIGKAFSRKIWKATIAQLSQVDRKLHVQSYSFRRRDAVFNLLDRLEVRIHD